MPDTIKPLLGELIDIPGIGACEVVREMRACHHSEREACALRFCDAPETGLYVCNSRENIAHIRCGSGTCFKKIEATHD